MTDMTKQTEAMKLALEAQIHKAGMNPVMQGECYLMHPEALQKLIEVAIREAQPQPAPLTDTELINRGCHYKTELMQPAKQEPVQRYSPDGEGGMEVDSLGAWMKFTSPQTQPAQRKPLTDEQIEQVFTESSGYCRDDFRSFARAIEATHGIKGDA